MPKWLKRKMARSFGPLIIEHQVRCEGERDGHLAAGQDDAARHFDAMANAYAQVRLDLRYWVEGSWSRVSGVRGDA